MTCIVGLVHNKNVYIGGDSAGVAGLQLALRADKKVFHNGPFLIGFSSSFRMGQLLRHAFDPPKRHPEVDIEKYMSTTFIDAVRRCFKDGGYLKKDNEEEKGGFFLVGFEGRLFNIQSDYQVGESLHGYDACGCGEDVALGSLETTKHLKMQPGERLLTALKAAEVHSAGVRAPFNFVSSED